jgi:hypothetical protein
VTIGEPKLAPDVVGKKHFKSASLVIALLLFLLWRSSG